MSQVSKESRTNVDAIPSLIPTYAPASPHGTYSTTPNAASSAACVNCPAGTGSGSYGATSAAACSSCGAGSFSGGGLECLSCPYVNALARQCCVAVRHALPLLPQDWLLLPDNNVSSAYPVSCGHIWERYEPGLNANMCGVHPFCCTVDMGL